MSKKVTVQMLSNCQYRKTGPKSDNYNTADHIVYMHVTWKSEQ
jgi:hypothetical protein